MPAEPASQPESPAQELREQFAAAVQAGDIAAATGLLVAEPQLANADLRAAEHRDHFTNGYPLFRACQHNHDQLVELLLEQGAHPDAPGNNPDDQPELGMPLHWAAVEHRNYRLANLLLDHGATPNGYPNCDHATIERMFYQAREAGVSDSIVRRAYARFLPDRTELESHNVADRIGTDAAESIRLFARMVDLGGQPPICAIVRDGFHDMVMEIVEHSHNIDGTPHDHPHSSVFNNAFGASRWYGYPKMVRRLMERYPEMFDYESAIATIGVAIGSHNRDGGYPEYREIIVMQLEYLNARGDIEAVQEDPNFKPLYQMATDFTWHSNYGHRADIAKPECYIDLAELFVSWGFNDINFRDPKTGHSPLSAAVKRGHHPGIATYIRWLLDHGADLRESDPDEVNPKAIALDKGFDEVRQLLQSV
ncbi:MAG: ankyrin repeat domain-containing protein [Pirellulaceae bacterium]